MIEDDYDSEYRFEGQPVPALQSLDHPLERHLRRIIQQDIVPIVTAGLRGIASILSRLFPGLPLSNRSPEFDFRSGGAQRLYRGWAFGAPSATHAQSLRRCLAALIEGSKQHLSGLLELSNVRAGLYTIGFLKNGMTSRRAEKLAADHGIEVLAVDRFTLRRPDPKALLLGFAAFDETAIRQGLVRLAKALS